MCSGLRGSGCAEHLLDLTNAVGVHGDPVAIRSGGSGRTGSEHEVRLGFSHFPQRARVIMAYVAAAQRDSSASNDSSSRSKQPRLTPTLA